MIKCYAAARLIQVAYSNAGALLAEKLTYGLPNPGPPSLTNARLFRSLIVNVRHASSNGSCHMGG